MLETHSRALVLCCRQEFLVLLQACTDPLEWSSRQSLVPSYAHPPSDLVYPLEENGHYTQLSIPFLNRHAPSSRQLSDSLKYSNINRSIGHKIRWQIIHREGSDLYSSMSFSRQLSITCSIYCADIKLATAVQYSTIGSSGSSINLGFQPPHPSCYKYQYTLLCLRFGSGKLCVLQNF